MILIFWYFLNYYFNYTVTYEFRKYRRLTNRQSWKENSMKAAIESVMKKEMGYKKASLTFCIPTTTLRE